VVAFQISVMLLLISPRRRFARSSSSTINNVFASGSSMEIDLARFVPRDDAVNLVTPHNENPCLQADKIRTVRDEPSFRACGLCHGGYAG